MASLFDDGSVEDSYFGNGHRIYENSAIETDREYSSPWGDTDTLSQDYAYAKNSIPRHQRKHQSVRPYEQCQTELGNAKRFVQECRNDICWVKPVNKFFIFNGSKWALDENGQVDRLARDIVKKMHWEAQNINDPEERNSLEKWSKKSQSRQSLTNMIELAKSEWSMTIPLNQFDTDPYLLNFSNGTMDLRTGMLRPHDRKDFISKQINFEYDPNALCPQWDSFIDVITDHNESKKKFLQRALGYSLTGITSEQKIFLLYGTGGNGKSVFLETILKVIGCDFVTNSPMSSLLESNWKSGANNDLARLEGLRIVTVDGIPQSKFLDEERIKEITGGGTITARYLYSEYSSFTPQFKLWISTNNKPRIKGYDNSIWRRICLIPFTVTIPEEKIDKNLEHKLLQEAQGILAWLVRGFLEWQKNGLCVPEEVVLETNNYRKGEDVFQSFLDEKVILCDQKFVRASDFYAEYRAWVITMGETPMSLTAFGTELTGRNFHKKRLAYGFVYEGITLSSNTVP